MTSFKRTQRKYVQKAYRVRNWREYETCGWRIANLPLRLHTELNRVGRLL